MSSSYSQVEAALNGQYVFNIKSLLRYSHQQTKIQIFPFIGAMFLTFAAVVVFAMILLSVFGIANPLEIERSTALQLEMLMMFFMAPIITAFLVMGIRSAVGKPIKPLDMLAYFPRIFLLGMVSIFISLWISVGFQLFIIPGLYLWVVTSLVLPLMVDKGASPFQAIKLSFKLTSKYLSSFVFIHGIILLLIIASALTYGLLFFYTVPFMLTLKGKIYADLVGYQIENDIIETHESRKDDTTFDA
ncbi:MAG: hypothetical protein P8J70_04745 [Glaciecola sp.]|jgi:hypothetical protein|nr:hypothetical protein [Glaciecola sp.]MDG1814834.1 hypothetical protein [Glaciecola sp.]MDG2098979.1 hypothetical protein [Glaciecola sp.]